MKHAFLLLPAIFLASSLPKAAGQKTHVILDGYGPPIRLEFTSIQGSKDAYSVLTISSTWRHTVFAPRNPIIRIPASDRTRLDQGIWIDVKGVNLHPSGYFLTSEYEAESQSHLLLFFLGNNQLGAQPLLIVGFMDDGTPYKVLERDGLDLTSFASSPQGATVVGKTSLSEVLDGVGGIGSTKPYATYDPYSVFLVTPGHPAEYSLAASRAYNGEHYVWAGPRTRSDYAVIYNLPGHSKPFGAPASKLIQLLPTGKKQPTP